jgi:putative transposase
MAWKEIRVEEERFRFVEQVRRDEWSLAEVCRSFGISRKTGYKWLERYTAGGIGALSDRSKAPRHQAREVLAEVAGAVIRARKAHPSWGPVKLSAWLEREAPEVDWPAPSTMGEILKREGLVMERRKRRQATPNARPLAHAREANDVWCADFKGWFRTGDGERCDPLTITDASSRYLLCCQAVERPDYAHVKPVFERVFREHGLPGAIRTDNGAPFASIGLAGLSRLAVWWLGLGIRPERIRPGKPAENGRHERMHKTLKQDTASPPQGNRSQQQAAFDGFRREYNEERPHAALQNQTPESAYRRSTRDYGGKLLEPKYPLWWEQRRVKKDGSFQWGKQLRYLGEALARQTIGMEPIEDGLWRLWLYEYELGSFDERRGKVRGAPRPPTEDRFGRPPGSLRCPQPVQSVENDQG